jgi:gliding motility-associated-like protein
VIASIRSSINGVLRDSSGCIPLTVDFADTIALGKRYVWNFGDGSPDTTTFSPNATHTFLTVGDYRVRLISIDSSSCNISDTAYMTIRARSNKATLGATVQKLPPCQSLTYQFNNTSVPPNGFSFAPDDFTWDLGDGTIIPTNAPSITHTYAATGTYNVKLYLDDTTFCNSPDSIVFQLRVSDVLVAQFITPAIGCAPYNAVFTNTSLGGQQFLWDFGDGTTSTDPNPTHLYSNPGTYVVHLQATDNFTCNPTDDTTATITVIVGPVSSFTYSPPVPKENTPYDFTNTSTNASNYKWDFGDGDTLITNSMLPVTHLFNASGTFNVCLIAFNANGCSDTSCQLVNAIVSPLADVPNAFSPNGDGINDLVNVKGYGIAKMTWSIYNRWGQLMFRSLNINNGWDGRYKGALQPQDVYAYILDITFTDNTQFRKKGDITLLR